MTACLSHSIGFCCASFHAVTEHVLAFQRPAKKKNLCSCVNTFVEVSDPYLPSTGCMAHNAINRCGILLQVEDASSRNAPKVWPSCKQVHSNLGCGCRTSYVLPLSGINYSCLFVLLQCSILHA